MESVNFSNEENANLFQQLTEIKNVALFLSLADRLFLSDENGQQKFLC